MLRYPLNDIRIFFEQFFIPLLRSVLYSRQEQLLIGMKTVDEPFFILLSKQGIMLDEVVKIVSFDSLYLCRFDTFQKKRLGVRRYRLSKEATKSPSKKNWKVISLPSL